MGYCSFESNSMNLRRIFYTLLLIYFAYFFYDIFFADSRSLWTLFAILLIIVPFLFEGYSGMYFPWKIKIIIVLSLLLHTIGEVHRWYYDLPHYDKISHLVSSVAIGYLVFLFIILIGLYYGLEWTRFKAIIFIILLTMAFAFFWEWWELFSDSYFGSKFFWDMQDGFGDTLINLSGAVFVAWDASKYLKEKTWTEVAGDFVRMGGTRPSRMRWEILPLSENLGVRGTAERALCKDGKRTNMFASSNEDCGSCAKTE